MIVHQYACDICKRRIESRTGYPEQFVPIVWDGMPGMYGTHMELSTTPEGAELHICNPCWKALTIFIKENPHLTTFEKENSPCLTEP